MALVWKPYGSTPGMPLSVSYKNQKKSSSLTKIPSSAMTTAFVLESEKVTIFVPASVGATNVLNGFPETAVQNV